MFEQNYKILEKLVEEKGVIIPVAEHRLPDGTFNLERNLKLWNQAVQQFEQVPLWEGAPPATTLKEPLFSQSRPSFLFPGKTEGKSGEPFWWPTAAGSKAARAARA